MVQNSNPQEGITVIMVSYWTGPVLFAAIESVLSPDQHSVVELIVVDNGNPPAVTGKLIRLSEEEPRLVLVSGHGNVGFSRGCNIGADRARSHYLLLLNPDCCLSPGAVPALMDEVVTLSGDWMLGCRLLNPDGTDQRGSRRALLTPYTALVETFRLDRVLPGLLRDHRLNCHDSPLPEDITCVPVISGACMMLPTATFHAIGGMDEGYFLHVEDLDICFRLHRAGIPVYFTPHVKAVHHAGSSRTNPVLVEWHKMRGFLRYYRIHFCNLRWLPWLGPLGIGIMARFGIKAAKSLFLMAWNRQAKTNDAWY